MDGSNTKHRPGPATELSDGTLADGSPARRPSASLAVRRGGDSRILSTSGERPAVLAQRPCHAREARRGALEKDRRKPKQQSRSHQQEAGRSRAAGGYSRRDSAGFQRTRESDG